MIDKIRMLERLLRPYSIDGGSSEFMDYDEYKKEDVSVRVDAYDDTPYDIQLENAARKLGLIK